MSQPGTAQPAGHAPVVSLGHFPVHEQPEAFLEAQVVDVGGPTDPPGRRPCRSV